ncbi:hypothetical protein V6N11_053390 [Hibiscus sabdariffa]|uniref:Uncharacterized protein n=1 Tax=Hibiscus sabdariffa TaxID=183260 RepID=A0ABR2UCX1_9ROSI
MQVSSQEGVVCASRRACDENIQTSRFNEGSEGQSVLATGSHFAPAVSEPIVSEAGQFLSAEINEFPNGSDGIPHILPAVFEPVVSETGRALPAATNEFLNEDGVGMCSIGFHENDSAIEPGAEIVSEQVPCNSRSIIVVNKTINNHPMVT